jgi:hypothetical protein
MAYIMVAKCTTNYQNGSNKSYQTAEVVVQSPTIDNYKGF